MTRIRVARNLREEIERHQKAAIQYLAAGQYEDYRRAEAAAGALLGFAREIGLEILICIAKTARRPETELARRVRARALVRHRSWFRSLFRRRRLLAAVRGIR